MNKKNLIKSLICLILVLTTALAPMSALAASGKAYILNVTAQNVRMRDGVTSSSSVVRLLKKGTKVLYWGVRKAAFCKVATTSGETGYVYRNYLSTYGALKKSQVYVTTKSTPVYKSSGSKLKKYTSVSAGRYLLVLGTSSGWAYVRTITGKAGYVPTSAIKKAF